MDSYSAAIVKFLTPFGAGANLASVLYSDPVALIKFLDKHPSMELYYDGNGVLQCIDKNSGKFIDYACDNNSEDKAIGCLNNCPRDYYPDIDALRACLIQESDGSE